MSTIMKHTTTAPILLSIFPSSAQLKKALGGRFIGIIPVRLYKPMYKLDIVRGKLKVSTGPNGANVTELLLQYKEKELAALPEGISISLNSLYQIIGIKHVGDTNYDNFFLYSNLVPFPCAPIERVKDNKPKALLKHLLALPSAVWNSERIGVLPESGEMLHLTGPSIAPMVFLSLEDKYKQMLRKIDADGFETLLYFAIRKSLPNIADLLIGTSMFGPNTYERHIRTWL